MQCCGQKMKCRYSVPMERWSRYRTYKCRVCGQVVETAEVTVAYLSEHAPEARASIQAARDRRYRWSRPPH